MLANISSWWADMDTLMKILWSIAIPFSLLFIIQMIMTFFGGDFDAGEADGNADIAVDADGGIDFQFLSLKNLIAFFTIFSWVGIVCIGGDMSSIAAIAIATGSGLLMMVIMATLMYYMGKLTETGTLNLNNAKGKTATVYLPIPAKRGGTGQVQIKVQGYQTLDAMTDGDAISTGALVEVVEIINDNILLVKSSGQ